MTTLALRPAIATPIRWSQAAFHNLPEGPPFYELENGELVEMARPTARHQSIIFELSLVIGPYLKKQRIGRLWIELEVDITPTQTYVPDLVFLANENLFRLEDDRRVVGRADMVAEVVSPSTGRRDRLVKLQAYQRAGVAWYWLVEEDLGIIEYKNSPAGYLVNQVSEPGQPFSPALFPGLTFNLAELMGETGQNVTENL